MLVLGLAAVAALAILLELVNWRKVKRSAKKQFVGAVRPQKRGKRK